MKVEDIIKLLDAGYTREEITAMTEDKKDPPEDKKDPPEEKKDPPEDKKDSPEDKMQEQFFQRMENMLKEFGIRHSSQPEAESVDDILAAIIRPPKKKEE